MPTTVTASNGNTYHLWQLPDTPGSGPPGSAPEPEISIGFTTLDNDLADGYRSTRLFGSNTGVREWKLTLPTLAASNIAVPTVTDINGATVSREEYVWSLYTENKVTGTPFAYTDPRTGQYYLVDFMDEQLTYARMRVKLYSTGLTLRQRRLPGVTIFDVSKISSIWARWIGDTSFVSNSWAGTISGQIAVDRGSTDVVDVAAAQNGHQIKRFSNTTNDGVCSYTGAFSTTYEIFLVMKMREATFSNAAGIITDTGSGPGTRWLSGSVGTTKFTDQSFTNYEYRKNGTLYAASNQQAPMNAWGIVHLRYPTGFASFTGLQFGKDRTTAGTFAEMDLGEVIFSSALLPITTSREITESLAVSWGIT